MVLNVLLLKFYLIALKAYKTAQNQMSCDKILVILP